MQCANSKRMKQVASQHTVVFGSTDLSIAFGVAKMTSYMPIAMDDTKLSPRSRLNLNNTSRNMNVSQSYVQPRTIQSYKEQFKRSVQTGFLTLENHKHPGKWDAFWFELKDCILSWYSQEQSLIEPVEKTIFFGKTLKITYEKTR